MRKEEGFTLIEIMAAMALAAVLMTLGAMSLRTFWWHRSLEGGADQIVSQVRELQERVVAETHPLVYGARFRAGSPTWGLVQYDPDAGTCTQYTTHTFDTSVYVSAASFSSDPTVTNFCRTALSAPSDEFVFFYARGNATPGSVTIRHDGLDEEESVTVAGVTGRADRT